MESASHYMYMDEYSSKVHSTHTATHTDEAANLTSTSEIKNIITVISPSLLILILIRDGEEDKRASPNGFTHSLTHSLNGLVNNVWFCSPPTGTCSPISYDILYLKSKYIRLYENEYMFLYEKDASLRFGGCAGTGDGAGQPVI